ncbi:TetR/AcrR family transcriptional regulator [Parvibaculum sp.]|uniref:TetR/AcrR family transcriptional regulator n=1 Tax=Parvibaculum sp. TaxID=2024848 RepID=UPI001D27DB55|nr:TetR/AcrR family transcriptional regulator [Parvibaculum sp.]MBX3489515.1 TetR family transcriptional regulator [Parvibaculum sp.]MCW5726529.1 TetR family transcriptional regulator [Parvibaculum sp.]
MENALPNQRDRILETARELIRRFGGAKTNVVDIAQAMGLSHSAIYRHFRSKAEIFDALAAATMAEEATLAETFVEADGPAAERLAALVLTLHRNKRAKFGNDPEMHALYRRIVEERPDLIVDYARRMTGLIRLILADGVARGEFGPMDLDAAAGAVRDAFTVFVHPAHVEAAAKAGLDQEAALQTLMRIVIGGLAAGSV